MALHWGIKRTLIDYVRSSGGTIELDDLVTVDDDRSFVFPESELSGQFRGRVRLLTYGGMLDWTLANPRITEGRLWVEDHEGVSAPIADLRNGLVVLTGDGAERFEDMYEPGTRLDDIRIGEEPGVAG